MNLHILESAMKDLHGARGFYERQEDWLGEYFYDSIFSDIDSLHLYAGIHRKFGIYHRLLADRFPHAIYYTVEEGDDVLIWRILDLRRDPRKIAQALK